MGPRLLPCFRSNGRNLTALILDMLFAFLSELSDPHSSNAFSLFHSLEQVHKPTFLGTEAVGSRQSEPHRTPFHDVWFQLGKRKGRHAFTAVPFFTFFPSQLKMYKHTLGGLHLNIYFCIGITLSRQHNLKPHTHHSTPLSQSIPSWASTRHNHLRPA